MTGLLTLKAVIGQNYFFDLENPKHVHMIIKIKTSH